MNAMYLKIALFATVTGIGSAWGQDVLSLPPTENARHIVTDRTWPAAYGDADLCLWKNDALSPFTLTIDDNHAADHAFWIALGEQYGWRWTWFVIAGQVEQRANGGTWADWQRLADLGHEIASHSVNHFYPGTETPLTVKEEYVQAQEMLTNNLNGVRADTLAYPNGYAPPNDDALAALNYIACRGVKGILNESGKVNYRNVNSVSGAQGFLEPENHWASFAGMLNPGHRTKFRAWYCAHFHGLTPELKTHLAAILDVLKAHEADVWVAPFREVAQYAQERDTAVLTVNGRDALEIRFSLTDGMPDASFDYPLTVKVRLDASWQEAKASQNGTPTPVEVIRHEGNRYALVQVVPDRGQVTLTNPAPIEIVVLRPSLQPATVPGNWNTVTAQPRPALEGILERSGPGAFIYGLYAWAGEYHTHRDSIRRAGWKAIRIAGPFDDRLMQALAEDGMETMVTLSNRQLEPGQGMDRTDFSSDEELIEAYGQAVDRFLKRYGPGGTFFDDHPDVPDVPIRHVELWNEPNFQYLIPPDGRPQDELEAAREELYAKLVMAISPRIRADFPEVRIVAMSGGGMSAGDLRFIDHVHAAAPGIVDAYDILSTHPYVRPAPPEANSVQSWGSYSIARGLEFIREVLAREGRADVPVWYTEIGWPISQEDGGRYPTPANQAFVSPDLQAAYVCRTYAWAMRLGVDRVHIMFAVDTDNFNGGFFQRDGAWRPSAHAVQAMIGEMPNPRLAEVLHDGDSGGLYAYVFLRDADQADTPSNRVIMAWNLDGPREWEVDGMTGTACVVDMTGRLTEHELGPAPLVVEVGPYPVYIGTP